MVMFMIQDVDFKKFIFAPLVHELHDFIQPTGPITMFAKSAIATHTEKVESSPHHNVLFLQKLVLMLYCDLALGMPGLSQSS
jgi:hypothetical protein